MIILGLFQLFYGLSNSLIASVSPDFVMPTQVQQVWQYMVNLLSNGKAIMSLFLDLPYLYQLITVVMYWWMFLLALELISWVMRLIKFRV